MSWITITGDFSNRDLGSWLSACLPELPSKAPEGEVQYIYGSTYLQTQLELTLR